jgi:hypothetical protein
LQQNLHKISTDDWLHQVSADYPCLEKKYRWFGAIVPVKVVEDDHLSELNLKFEVLISGS